MCYHLDGFVQKYAVYKTEDLPNLSPDCKFSPSAVRDMAKNVLAFLKQKATQVLAKALFAFSGGISDMFLPAAEPASQGVMH